MSSYGTARLFGVQGLIAVVTGGGTGIGLMMANALEQNGAKVYIVGRRMEVLQKAANNAKHGRIIPLQCDVSSKEDLSKVVDYITKTDGFVNVLVANSGIPGPTLEGLKHEPSLSEISKFLWETDTPDFMQTYRVNVSAVYYSVAAFLPLLDAGNKRRNTEQSSQVVTISSTGAFTRSPLAGFAYHSSKAAVTHMMKMFSTFLAPHGIRSNVIAPGVYPSEMSGEVLKKNFPNGIPTSFVPAKRTGTADDMAGAILFLISRAGAYLNGNVLISDGGRISVNASSY